MASTRPLKLKAAIYTRVSTHWQVDKDSLKVQERELIAYCQMVLGIDEYVIFTDPGFSAKDTDRPEYQNMMERIRSGEFTHLLVWKIDRISRNIVDFAMMSNELKQLGVTFVSKNEQFDTSTAMGEAMLQIIMVFAQFERKQTSERVSAVMISRAENGQWNGGKVPYGYRWDKENKSFYIVESEANIIRRAAELYLEHQSLLYVSRALSAEGVKSKTGTDWTSCTVHKILVNPWYIGQYTYNARATGNPKVKKDESQWVRIDHHHQAIIDEETYKKICDALTRNRRMDYTGRSYLRKHNHIFAGLMKCGVCGSNMSACKDHPRANGLRPSVYACTNRRNTANCDNKYASDLWLVPFVFTYVSNIISASHANPSIRTTEDLERRLLRGEPFADVSHICSEALQNLLDTFSNPDIDMEYRPAFAFASAPIEDLSTKRLEDRKRKLETALSRLHTLFLYGDEAMSEQDYTEQRTAITTEIAEVESKIQSFETTKSEGSEEHRLFLKKASYLIMVKKLQESSKIELEHLLKTIDTSVMKDFANCIVQEIEVLDGRVTSITFQNGVKHSFTYSF